MLVYRAGSCLPIPDCPLFIFERTEMAIVVWGSKQPAKIRTVVTADPGPAAETWARCFSYGPLLSAWYVATSLPFL